MRSTGALGLVVLAACGRVGFGTFTSPGSAGDAPGAGDARSDAVTSTCATALLCDGFETEAAGFDARYQVDTFSGAARVDSLHAHRGTLAAHFSTAAITTPPVTDPHAVILSYNGLPITGTVYARVWAYFSNAMPAANFAQYVNFANAPGQGISLGTQAGFLVDNDYTNGAYKQSSTTISLDTWICLQMTMPSDTSDTVRIFIDGVELTDIAITPTSPQPAPDHVYLGIDWVANVTNQTAYDMWIDDVIVDRVATTCAE